MPTNKAFEIMWKLTQDAVHCFHRDDPEFQKYYVIVNDYAEQKLVECNEAELKLIYTVIRNRYIKEFNKEHGNDTYSWE